MTITIDDALKVLAELKVHPMHKRNLYHKEAVSLAMDALKYVSIMRQEYPKLWQPLLRSETNEARENDNA